ncbi:hypothetical protein AMECASPLE_023297 [Ameca splendens]|uniref:Uncharacterized protein n=1 Tax=Ameca splendens TaxID=208324 RepID=A0ABV0ZZL2_9TELE
MEDEEHREDTMKRIIKVLLSKQLRKAPLKPWVILHRSGNVESVIAPELLVACNFTCPARSTHFDTEAEALNGVTAV